MVGLYLDWTFIDDYGRLIFGIFLFGPSRMAASEGIQDCGWLYLTAVWIDRGICINGRQRTESRDGRHF